MRHIKYIVGIIAVTGLTVTMFNNCGPGVEFTPADTGSVVQLNSSEQNDSFASSDETVSGWSDEDLLELLPEEEQDIYRPISDIINDPYLAEMYSCPDSDGTMICHFPNNVSNAHTLCVGGGAPETHMAHEADISPNGELLSLSDYLGPCKHVVE